MKEKEARILIIKFLENRISIPEANQLLKWLEADHHRESFNQYAQIHYLVGLQSLNIDRAFKEFEERVKQTQRKKKALTFLRYAAVFVILITMGYGGITLWQPSSENIITKTSYPTTISSHNRATLTLGDGSSIPLQNGEFFQAKNIQSTGDRIIYSKIKTPNAEIEYNHLTIPRGGQFYIILEDGTGVWLNSDSKLTYPTHFKEESAREVELVYGEAYFEVSPSSIHKGAKFIVHSKHQDIKVLGTKFNLRAYKDEKAAYTTLTEGKIKLITSNKQVVLTPGEQSTLEYTSKNLSTDKVKVSSIISWREGIFDFNDASLEEIMRVLSRWYDIKVTYKTSGIKKERFTGIFGKDQDLKEILTILRGTNNIEYTIKKDTVIIE